MIKRIIFDVDGTLIPWKDEYDEITFSKTLEEFKIKYDKNLLGKFSKAINNYEKVNNTYSREQMIKQINKQTNQNLKTDFLECWFENILKYATPEKIDTKIISTLEYLSKKYELVILSNWFEKPQKERIEKCGIYKYFKEIYISEKFKNKPNEEAFRKAINMNKPEECIMVGDSLKSDIIPASKIGIRTIWLCEDSNEKNINSIKELCELKEIL